MENSSEIEKTDHCIQSNDEPEAAAEETEDEPYVYAFKEAADFDDYLAKYYNNKILKFDKNTMYELPRPFVVAFHHYNERFWQIDYITYHLEKVRKKYEGRLHFAVGDFTDEILLSKGPGTAWGPGVIIINENPWIYAVTKDKKVWSHGGSHAAPYFDEFCEKIASSNLEGVWRMKHDL